MAKVFSDIKSNTSSTNKCYWFATVLYRLVKKVFGDVNISVEKDKSTIIGKCKIRLKLQSCHEVTPTEKH
jgi:hypothetical protein